MKILITTDLFATDTNGVATSVRNLWKELTGKGHDVRILTLSNSTHSYTDGSVAYIRSVPIDIVYPNVRMPLSYRHPLIRELIRWKPDVIHSQCEFFSFQYAKRISRLTGAPIIHTYYHRLLGAGVAIYEYEPGFIHAKCYLADDEIAMIGTINLDYRSLVHHFENGVWMYGCASIEEIKKDFSNTLAVSLQVDAKTVKTNLLQKVIRSLVRIFAPLL